jgi:hypothetical protein
VVTARSPLIVSAVVNAVVTVRSQRTNGRLGHDHDLPSSLDQLHGVDPGGT